MRGHERVTIVEPFEVFGAEVDDGVLATAATQDPADEVVGAEQLRVRLQGGHVGPAWREGRRLRVRIARVVMKVLYAASTRFDQNTAAFGS
jgi:hypothetical protein